MSRHGFAAVLIGLCLAAGANDGPAIAVPAGGITFQKTDAIAMETEDLSISQDRVSVAYTFRNLTDKDVTVTVAFPLPIYRIFEFEDAQPGYRDFTVTVDGKPVAYETVDEAVLCEGDGERISPAPIRGPLKELKNVTAIVTENGLPIVEYEPLFDALDKLTGEQKAALAAAGAITIEDDGYPNPQWCIKTTYHWEQTFKANSVTTVSHTYTPKAGSFTEWHLEPYYTDEYLNGDINKIPLFGTDAFNKACGDFLKTFDVDDGIQKWAATQRADGRRFGFVVVDYILTTGALWSGSIKRFTLTIEKPEPYEVLNPGDPQERIVVSTAESGLKKSGDRTFTVTRENFTPEKDLSVLFIHSYPGY